jgi:two-component system sensor histidine kinase KdpD
MRLPSLQRARPWLLWIGVLLAVTAALVTERDSVDPVAVTLVYLLVVLGGSASGGRALGFALACACFLLIDYYLQTPFDTLSIDKPLDWLVLLAFLVTAAVATQLLGRANAEAAAARQRAEEIDRLAALGAETLSVGRAEDARSAIARVIQETIGAGECEVYAYEPEGDALVVVARTSTRQSERRQPFPSGLVAWVAAERRAAGERLDGSVMRLSDFPGEANAPGVPFRSLLLPLVAHGRTMGVLRLADPAALALDAARWRFLTAIAYYAALAIERVLLVAEAEHAEALREADRLKDALLASVSHDLRTPLTTIKALAHDIAISGDERAAEIEQQSDRLNHMVADLLELSRLNAGGLPLEIEINTAEDLVGTAIQQVSGALTGREVNTALEWSAPVPIGRFDFIHSLRILVNLIENAVKYSPAGSPIDLTVGTVDGMLTITVADRGRGVAPLERERIFQPFYRPAGASPDVGGAGLGLAIARRLAEAQGGTLTYADRPGGGSVFTLRLPAADLTLPGAGESL